MTTTPRPENSADSNRVSRTTHNIEDHLLGQQSQVEHGSIRALYDELHTLRNQDMPGGKGNPGQFVSDAAQVIEQLHKDGFLPRIHLVTDGRNNLGLVDEKGQFVGRDTPLQPGDVPSAGGPPRQTGALDLAPPVVPQGMSLLPDGAANQALARQFGLQPQAGGLGDPRAIGQNPGDVLGAQTAAAAAEAEQRMHRTSAEGPAAMDSGRPAHRQGRHHGGGRHGGRHGRHGRHGRRGGHHGGGAPPQGEADTAEPQEQANPAADILPRSGRNPIAAPAEGAKPWESSNNAGTVPVQRGRDSDIKVTGASTITPQKIDEVLKQYNSPAYGHVSGQEVYDKSLQHGINPAISLAFYVLESSAGTRGKGARNNSWGNFRTGDSRNGYRSFDDIHTSLDHFLDSLSGSGYVGEGRTTIGTVLPKYAPAKDHNNTGKYIHDMASLLRKWES